MRRRGLGSVVVLLPLAEDAEGVGGEDGGAGCGGVGDGDDGGAEFGGVENALLSGAVFSF